MSNQRVEPFPNGLILLTDVMEWSESVSYSLVVPCGTAHDPSDRAGIAGLTSEMGIRGAGNYDNRELLSALENLGAETSEGVGQASSSFRASMLPENFDAVLALTADMIFRPRFPQDELVAAKQVLAQEIAALEDEPSRKMMMALGQKFFPAPWGRPSFGTLEGLEAVELSEIVAHHHRHYIPDGAILSVAGKIDPDRVRESALRLFGDWKTGHRAEITETFCNDLKTHIESDSAQTHIGLAWPSVPMADPDYLPLQCGTGALSGGMSSRLFTEVREKRGLCYTVYASYSPLKNRAGVFCYCGSGAETAQEALDVMVAEAQKLSDGGITEAELARIQIRSKSGLVMEQESTGARCGAMARDWYHLGRVRSLEEMLDRINRLTVAEINGVLKRRPVGPMRLVTLGREPLAIDETLLG